MVGYAGVAQLVEHQLPKLRVVGSSPIARSSREAAHSHGNGVVMRPLGLSGASRKPADESAVIR
jgi:hypothetical protein